MPSKRTSLQKRRGIDAIFESQPQLQNPDSLNQQAQDIMETTEPTHTMIKLTVMVPQYIQWGLDEIQLNESRRTGKKPEKYTLAKEAFDLLFKQYGITENQKIS